MKRIPETALRQRLYTEAHQTRPPFSPLLHERIMTALRASTCADPSQLPIDKSTIESPNRRINWRIVIPLAAAAALALATWHSLRPAPTPEDGPPQPIAVQNLPSLPTVPTDLLDPVRQLTPSADTLDQAKFAYLDRDARRLALFVADQLPTFTPEEKSPK